MRMAVQHSLKLTVFPWQAETSDQEIERSLEACTLTKIEHRRNRRNGKY